ncbi:hypothetical protein CMO93_01710 [Candidatus Woesearchaeota archaeon]|nr:hypothetical protein [Candidatus Woesearchaeota archaeon]|tara:strand:- start:1151 stop:1714 length:564 start_codon:yes stop_codon:yes gene_type:complete
MVYPFFKNLLVFPYCRLQIRKIKGIKNIPKKSNFIITSNHENRIDPLYLLYPFLRRLNKKIHFLAQPKLWFLGEKICRQWAGCIPLFNSKQSYAEIKEYLKKGKIVALFPQGSYKKEDNNKFKTGVIRLAMETKTPILPIGIKSSYFPFSSALNIGKLVYSKKNKKGIEAQTADLMKYVYALRSSIG